VYGLEKHKRIALWGIIESVANLSLSVVLVRRIGIYGVAWGTTIPSVIMEMVLWPRYICGLLAIPVRTYLWQTWFRTGLSVIPFALACAAAERFWPAHNLLVFFLQIAALLPLLPLTVVLIFRNEVAAQASEWLRRRRSSDNLSREYETSTTTVG
jgi:O-antigen/teichoic acid export membrane protein